MAASIVIAAGGTGGHIYPGLALADALRELTPAARITFVGTARGLERSLVPNAGYDLELVGMRQYTGLGWRKLLAPTALLRATLQSRRLLRRVGASVVVGMGGYASVPVVIAARLARVPSLIHEPGVMPGRANLLAARFTRRVATAFEGANRRFPEGRELRTVGMPLSRALATFDRDAVRARARAELGVPDGTRLVLVSGGSQGSATLNRLALGLAERWRGRDDARILLKPGTTQYDEVEAALAENPGRDRIELTRFIERMDHAYAAADFGIFRAGAATVAELAVVGLPSILVPFPHLDHDEQGYNAKVLVDAGGALLVRDPEAVPAVVGPMVEALLESPHELAEMRASLSNVAHPRAAEQLASWALELATP